LRTAKGKSLKSLLPAGGGLLFGHGRKSASDVRTLRVEQQSGLTACSHIKIYSLVDLESLAKLYSIMCTALIAQE
jgi:hypothetical protein